MFCFAVLTVLSSFAIILLRKSELVPGGGGGGGTLIFSYIRRLGPFLGGSKF